MVDGSGAAPIEPGAPRLLPKAASTIVRSLISTVPLPVNSPSFHPIFPGPPATDDWPKCAKTIVKSLMSTLPSAFASPGIRASRT